MWIAQRIIERIAVRIVSATEASFRLRRANFKLHHAYSTACRQATFDCRARAHLNAPTTITTHSVLKSQTTNPTTVIVHLRVSAAHVRHHYYFRMVQRPAEIYIRNVQLNPRNGQTNAWIAIPHSQPTSTCTNDAEVTASQSPV